MSTAGHGPRCAWDYDSQSGFCCCGLVPPVFGAEQAPVAAWALPFLAPPGGHVQVGNVVHFARGDETDEQFRTRIKATMSAPTLPQAIAAERARFEAEQGEPVSRGSVVVGLIWSGLLREAERRVREREEQIARLAPPAEHPAVTLLREIEWSGAQQVGQGDGCESCCPCCRADAWNLGDKGTHAPGCKLAALIKERT